MLDKIKEGSSEVYVYKQEKVSKDLPVFYNPLMKLNRDISIILLNSIDKNNMQIALPLAASGIRGIRFLLELKKNKIKNITFNDNSKKAITLIKKNLELNKLDNSKKIKLVNKDANLFLQESKGFDYIDIDPFGSPNFLLESSITRLSRQGILAVTATDTSGLSGTYPKVTKRKYFSKSLKNEFMHETGIRILIKKVQLIGAHNEKALIPIFSYFKNHYYRVFFKCIKSKTKVDEILDLHGFILWCRNCLFRKVSFDIFNSVDCEKCRGKLDYAGSLWTGKLWDYDLVVDMINNTDPENKNLFEFLRIIKHESEIFELEKDVVTNIMTEEYLNKTQLKNKIKKEYILDSLGFYDLHEIAKKYKIEKLPKIEKLISKIESEGNKVSRTHFSGTSLRTRIKINELVKIIKGV